MKHYRVSRDAERDLDEVFAYWAGRAGTKIADWLIDSLTERFWIVGEYPDSGRECGNIARGVKCFPAGKYLIYYRKVRGGVEIARIFHGSRNQKKAWQDRKK